MLKGYANGRNMWARWRRKRLAAGAAYGGEAAVKEDGSGLSRMAKDGEEEKER